MLIYRYHCSTYYFFFFLNYLFIFLIILSHIFFQVNIARMPRNEYLLFFKTFFFSLLVEFPRFYLELAHTHVRLFPCIILCFTCIIAQILKLLIPIVSSRFSFANSISLSCARSHVPVVLYHLFFRWITGRTSLAWRCWASTGSSLYLLLARSKMRSPLATLFLLINISIALQRFYCLSN